MHFHTTVPLRTRGAALILIGLLAGGLVPLAAADADNPASVPSVVVPLDPQRILDTRVAIGIGSTTPIGPDQTITLQVTGTDGVPAGATGVLLNLTINSASGAGYVTAYPSGGTRPTASVINYTAGEDVANMITATLGAGGAIDLYNAQASAHLIADVAGYLVPGGGGTPGPAGPQGPQGPAGASAPAGIEFENLTITRPPVGVGPFVNLGTIDGTTIQLQCGGPVASTLRFSTTTGVRFNGALIDDSGAASVESSGVGGSGSISFPMTELTHVSATLRLPNLGLTQLEATVGPMNTSFCVGTGSVIPTP